MNRFFASGGPRIGVHRVPFSPHPHQCAFVAVDSSPSHSCVMISHHGFLCMSQMSRDAEHLFMCLLSIRLPYLRTSLCKSSVHFNERIHRWLCWVFLAFRGLSLVVASGELLLISVHRPSHYSSFSSCRARALGIQASVVVGHKLSSFSGPDWELWLSGLAASQHVGSSWTKGQTRVPCAGRGFLSTASPGKSLCPFLKSFLFFWCQIVWDLVYFGH